MTSPRFQPEKRNLIRPLELALASYEPLSLGEIEFLRSSLTEVQAHGHGALIRRAPGENPGQTLAVLFGWVAWLAQLSDGRRQILALALPGDLLEEPPAGEVEVAYAALGSARTADASALATALAAPTSQLQGLARAWRATRKAASTRWVRQVLRLGRLSAYERTASLMVELHERQRRAGLADDRSMPLPLTQEMLSDFLGLSVVHVNRMLQQLRRDNLIVYRSGQVTFPDLPRLSLAAGRR